MYRGPPKSTVVLEKKLEMCKVNGQ